MTDLRVDAVLFDKDGTLFDFATTWEAWAKSFLTELSDGDAVKAQDMGAAIGFDTVSYKFAPDSIAIAGNPAEVAAPLLPFMPDHTLTSLLTVLNTAASQAPQAEAVPLQPFLADLRGMGLQLGVATNDAEAPARMHLQKAGVEQATADGFCTAHRRRSRTYRDGRRQHARSTRRPSRRDANGRRADWHGPARGVGTAGGCGFRKHRRAA